MATSGAVRIFFHKEDGSPPPRLTTAAFESDSVVVSGGKLCVSTTAVQAQSPLVLDATTGAWLRVACEHWRGPEDTPRDESPQRDADPAVVIDLDPHGVHQRHRHHCKPSGDSAAGAGMPVLRTDVGIERGQRAAVGRARAGGRWRRGRRLWRATTPELQRLAAWLQGRGVTSVALESTGVVASRRINP